MCIFLRRLRAWFSLSRPRPATGGIDDPPQAMPDVRHFAWYDSIDGGSLEQGDILFKFQIVVPSPEASVGTTDQLALEVKTFDVVVMTQTCDIENEKVKSVLLCPCWDLWQFVDAAKEHGENWGGDLREALRRGNLPGYHLINEASQDGIRVGLLVVDFHEVYTAPTNQVKEFVRGAGKRLRLRPPYREHLAQAFARFFMRVGLPVDIPKEKVKKRPRG